MSMVPASIKKSQFKKSTYIGWEILFQYPLENITFYHTPYCNKNVHPFCMPNIIISPFKIFKSPQFKV